MSSTTPPGSIRHILEVDDLSADELLQVLDLSGDPNPPKVLEGKGMALLFEKPSARTRHSMEMAVVQLGGHPVTVAAAEVGIDQRESAEDVARTLACFHAAIGARVKSHSLLERMATVSSVPVVNMLSDQAHPLQALADLLTVKQEFGEISGRRIAFVGDANNVSRSLAIGAGLAGAQFVISGPPGYQFESTNLDRIAATGGAAEVVDDPFEAVTGAHVVYTDVWVSMGEEAQASEKIDAFAGRYSVSKALMGQAAADAIFLHCLPANPGQEASEEILYGPQSRIWQQAENRMHAARGLLAWLLGVS